MIVPTRVWMAARMMPPENPSGTQPRAACGSVVAVAKVMCAVIWMSNDADDDQARPDAVDERPDRTHDQEPDEGWSEQQSDPGEPRTRGPRAGRRR